MADQVVLKRTSFACPEQYNVVDEAGEQVGYLRLRHGRFTVNAWNPSGADLFARQFGYQADPVTEPEEQRLPDHDSDGIFEDDRVRQAYLDLAVRKLAEYHDRDFEYTVADMVDDN